MQGEAKRWWRNLPCRPRGVGRLYVRSGRRWPWHRVPAAASHTPNSQTSRRHTGGYSHLHSWHPPERRRRRITHCWSYSLKKNGRPRWRWPPRSTWAPASRSSRTHSACPRTQASCKGVMESTATTLTEAPLWMRCCSRVACPCEAALCTSVLSAQQPAGNSWQQTNQCTLDMHGQYYRTRDNP